MPRDTDPRHTYAHRCDFGASLQLGLDLFNHSTYFAPLAARTLGTAYSLLEREAYAQIATMHGKHRATS